MEHLPISVHIGFILTTLLTLWFIYRASKKSNLLLGIFVVWLMIQGFVASTGFYLYTESMPPRFALLILPPLLTIIYFFSTKSGRTNLDRFDTSWLTYMHVVRIPVELTLWFLFLYGFVPELMTFEGRNWDVISGISAPIVAYFAYNQKKLSSSFLLFWNFICLVLLLNIVINAILSAPFPLQQFAFDQPNRGVFYFPFVWLPGFIVPLVLFSHLVCIRSLIARK